MRKNKKELRAIKHSVVMAMVVCVCAYAQPQNTDLTDLSLDELSNIKVKSTATLTDTKPRLVPAAVTTITDEQIEASGARSLFELLDIYVPNLQWKRNMWEADNIGLRGIINDRNDKFLLLVNGRIMNEHTHTGVVTELDLPMLNDIHHIDVVRGPGSSLYGPGAISMVINIITYNANTFKGTEITSRLVAIEESYTAEIKHTFPSDDNDGGWFTYAGIGKTPGADKGYSPQIYGFDFPSGPQFGWDTYSTPSDGTRAGHPLLNPPINNDNADYKDLPPIKLHAQFTKDNWDIWARYTRGGKQFGWDPGIITRAPYGWYNWFFLRWPGPTYLQPEYNAYAFNQITGYIAYYQEQLVKDVDVDYAFSYQLLDYLRTTNGQGYYNESYREDSYYGKILLKWQPSEQHRIAFGPEIYHYELGLQSLFLNENNPSDEVLQNSPLGRVPTWSTNLYSLLGEWQWNINDKWTTFLGGRIDDHTYTKQMYSPRAAIVHTPTEKDTYKAIWTRSVRASYEEEMKATGYNTDPEKLDSFEFRYERQQNKNLDLAASFFIHYNLDIISYSGGRSSINGTQKEWGLEFEASYHTDRTRLLLSHAYTKLIDFQLEPGKTTLITAEPYGYGRDLAQWSNHITKAAVEYKLDEKWTLDSSLRIYWGFPGMEDYDHYAHDTFTNNVSQLYEPDWEKAYRGNYYLNLGLRYKPSPDLTIGVMGYYLLGIFNKDLNKRNTGYSGFRDHAPAVSVSVEYRF